ncbi:MAG: hypothetical protein J0L66_15890 [Cytophagales bacterium]|nr:hypothetical protein [Cytophagales bacterium]
MKKEVLEFYSSLRLIFGVCPDCEEIFRVSDCKLYQKKRPGTDWKEKLENEIERLEILEEKLSEKIERAREAEREKGRREADKLIKKIDPIFRPLRLNPNDAKVIFHPVDFVVFNGMNNNFGDRTIKNLLLLDKDDKQGEFLKVQNSLNTAVDRGSYEWLTLRVDQDGEISEE